MSFVLSRLLAITAGGDTPASILQAAIATADPALKKVLQRWHDTNAGAVGMFASAGVQKTENWKAGQASRVQSEEFKSEFSSQHMNAKDRWRSKFASRLCRCLCFFDPKSAVACALLIRTCVTAVFKALILAKQQVNKSKFATLPRLKAAGGHRIGRESTDNTGPHFCCILRTCFRSFKKQENAEFTPHFCIYAGTSRK